MTYTYLEMKNNATSHIDDLPAHMNLFGIRRYQWLRNAEGGQGFGTQTVYVPLTCEIFDQFVLPRLREPLRSIITTLEAYHLRWPEDTHAEFYSSEGRWEWRLARVGPLCRLLPRGRQLFYAEKVESFDSEKAQQWGARADSDLYPPGTLDGVE